MEVPMARITTGPFSRALVIEGPHPSLDNLLAEHGIEVTRLEHVVDDAALIDALHSTRAQILFKRSQVPVSRDIVEACPDLHLIQLCCIGDDSVDKQACAEHGVLVCNDPVSNGRSVVELAIAHLIALSRRLYETDAAAHLHRWEKSSAGRYEVHGKRLGIVGLGNIGRAVARAASALGMDVLFHDSRAVAVEVGQEMGFVNVPTLEALFRQCDMISVHTSATDAWGRDNVNLLDPLLGQLGADRAPDAPRLFLNLARGNLHSAEALLDAVRSGAIRRAAVDVYPEEPGPGAADWLNPYAEEPRVVCTPHIGAATLEAQPQIARRVAATVEGLSRFGALRDCVFAPRAAISVREDVAGRAILTVVHSVSRGTKKAIDDAIFEAGASNLESSHRDFDAGVAYDVSVLDRPLSDGELARMVERAAEISNDPNALRAVRQILVGA
jgi:D-3-phosphoglycerate dehydrogenase / 2-oxoglutarate reductase